MSVVIEKGDPMNTQSRERMSDAGSVSAGAPSLLASTFSSLIPHDQIEIREAYADVGDVRLHYVEAGEGPLVVLLHGFPAQWSTWRPFRGWRFYICAARKSPTAALRTCTRRSA